MRVAEGRVQEEVGEGEEGEGGGEDEEGCLGRGGVGFGVMNVP